MWLTQALIAFFGAALVCAQQPVAIVNKQTYQSPIHSFQGGEAATLARAWASNNVRMGTPRDGQDSFFLSTRSNGKTFYLFNRYPLMQPGFEIRFDVHVLGPPETKSANGFAVWLAEERSSGVFYRPADNNVWSFFGYKPNFKGFATFFSTNDRTNQPTASISGAYSNGTKAWDSTTSVPSNDGIYYNFRNSAAPLNVKLVMAADSFRAFIKNATDKDYKLAFTLKFAAEAWKSQKSYFLGLSASNRRIVPGESAVQPGNTGDSVLIKNFRVISEDLNALGKSEIPGQDLLRRHVHSPDADALSVVKGLADVVERFLLPQQEHILHQLSLLDAKHEAIGNRVDILHAYLTKGSTDPDLKKAVENMGSVLDRSVRDQNNRLAELQGKLESAGNERSASLESTIKSHAQLSSYLTVGLGSVFIIFGVVIYKRMRDMEKKHIL
eukprot:Gregarina_sp_Pseudo_9__682@NODE_1433_length_1605_cov_112_181992_g1331_i0_p1_GENE_NODE_1433_length_1605_cov_112_181992_g1331_i0NODE_1433_length_1605_cov_112_181992_g1331_i0_p1_ORF_typecomplete_len440_score105_63Lectin_leglike/PF03388_13/5e22Herpes_UL6/PF01763_16/0_01Med21/PF11221_8/0_28_NODE_1433_length_1605_cov_112_181992_g1331_i0721391